MDFIRRRAPRHIYCVRLAHHEHNGTWICPYTIAIIGAARYVDVRPCQGQLTIRDQNDSVVLCSISKSPPFKVHQDDDVVIIYASQGKWGLRICLLEKTMTSELDHTRVNINHWQWWRTFSIHRATQGGFVEGEQRTDMTGGLMCGGSYAGASASRFERRPRRD
jgi:hypothetical protein